MSTHKKIDLICIIALILMVAFTVLFINGEKLGITAIVDEDAEQNKGDVNFTANDLKGDWDDADAVKITLNGTDCKISGNGAYSYDGDVYIAGGGYYVFSGSLTDGSIIVDAYDTSKVWIKLDGVDIYCSDDAALRVNQADKVFVTLAEGSENSIKSGSDYSEEALSDGAGGAIFTHDDMTINGSGALSITAEYKHGIDANDSLVITGGGISITAPEDGIHVNDEFEFTGADLTINAGDDAIHSDESILVTGGSILINECYEGLEALTIEVTDGDIEVHASDDGFNANGDSGDGFGFGGFGGKDNDTADASDNDDDGDNDDDETWIHISGGNIRIINETGNDADGLDSNGDIIISGGDIRISLVNTGSNSAIDYGSENGGVCEISGGTVVACGSYSMAEAFDSTSTQCAILYTYSAGAEAGTNISLEDTDGNVIISYDAPCSFSSVNISCPELTIGESYLVVIGDNVEEITIDEVSASYGDAASSMFGGNMNWGGMQDRSEFGGMNGGRGGHGGRGMKESESDTTENTDSDSTEMPQKPDFEDGDFDKEMPDFAKFDGEMPDFADFDGDMSDMPTPPDMEDFEGEMPEMDDFGDFGGGRPDDMRMSEQEAVEETKSVSTGKSLSELDTDVYIWLGLSIIALAAGIIFAIKFKRY